MAEKLTACRECKFGEDYPDCCSLAARDARVITAVIFCPLDGAQIDMHTSHCDLINTNGYCPYFKPLTPERQVTPVDNEK